LEDHLSSALTPIGLDEVLEQAALQTRTDNKYLVDRSVLDLMVVDLRRVMRCLTIENRTVAHYRSIYFDTSKLAFYHQHLQGRRHRFKVRTRSYVDTCSSMLEVKAKGYRALTVKERVPWPDSALDHLGTDGDEFIAGVVGSRRYRSSLEPVIENTYRRATLVDTGSQSRVTCDIDLSFRKGAIDVPGPRGKVPVETKSTTGRCTADRWFQAKGIRPLSMSKYCIGIALLYPDVRVNPWHRVLTHQFGWSPPSLEVRDVVEAHQRRS